MISPTKLKQPLGERSSNLPSPVKSPSKIPLPPSPTQTIKQKQQASETLKFAETNGPMVQLFNEPTEDDKPTFVRKIMEAHDAGQTYVSPSDDILSPTTKKLSEVKGRRFGNFKKSSSLYNAKSLFAKSIQKPNMDTMTIEDAS